MSRLIDLTGQKFHYLNQLFILRNRCLQTVADHLKNISVFPVCSKHMSMLEREYRDNHKRESEGEEDNG